MATTNYCECDNTHEQNETVCQYCYEQGKNSGPVHVAGFNPPIPDMTNRKTAGQVRAFLNKKRKVQ